MNLRLLFGKQLKEHISIKKTAGEIGTWAFSFYWENIEDIDLNFRRILLFINKMELGYEF